MPDLLAEWVTAGLISPDQARAVGEHEARRATAPGGPAPGGPVPGPPAEGSLVVEALGYLGGIIMLVGALLLGSLFWADLPTGVRLLLIALAACALVAAGVAVPERLGDAAARLRSVLWALAVAATGAFMVVFTSDVLDRQDESSLLVVGPCTAAVAAVLWWRRPTWLQQLALLVPVVLTAIGVGFQIGGTDSSWPGGMVWIAATVWAAAAWAGWLRPRVTGVPLGGLVATFGGLSIDNDLGIALALGTAVALVVLALYERSLPWLGVAAVAVLQSTPRAAVAWFPGRLSAALTLIVTGGLLVAAAVWVARHQGGPTALSEPGRPRNGTGGRPEGRPPVRD
nr:DUF2157 domain-containing protein [Nocardioides panaciterrulae]